MVVNRRSLFKIALGAAATLAVKPLAALVPAPGVSKPTVEPVVMFDADELQWLSSMHRLIDGEVRTKLWDTFQVKESRGFSQVSPGDYVLISYGSEDPCLTRGGIVIKVIHHGIQDGGEVQFDLMPNDCAQSHVDAFLRNRTEIAHIFWAPPVGKYRLEDGPW